MVFSKIDHFLYIQNVDAISGSSNFMTVLSCLQTLLGFINFKLYHSINVNYPPILDPRLEALAAGKC